MKALFIGDVHIKHSNVKFVDILIEKLSSDGCLDDVDVAVLAGDVLDSHEKIDSQLMNKAYELVNAIRKKVDVYVLVGNHDYINNQQFLTDNHWMNGMKEWDRVTVVDKVVLGHGFAFVPFVPPGKFEEALRCTTEDWGSVRCVFAHQEFKGCKMGAITSEVGDEWPLTHPLVISGHIHEPQRPQKNVIYPGSVINHSYGYDSQGISVFVFQDDEMYPLEEKIDLGFPKKNVLYVSVDKIKSINTSRLTDSTKINVEGTLSQIRAFKESSLYKNLNSRARVVLNISSSKNDSISKKRVARSFQEILEEMILKSKNPELVDDYRNIVNA